MPVTLDSVSFLVVLSGPLETSVLLAGVSDTVAVDDVGELTLERADCFFGGLANRSMLPDWPMITAAVIESIPQIDVNDVADASTAVLMRRLDASSRALYRSMSPTSSYAISCRCRPIASTGS